MLAVSASASMLPDGCAPHINCMIPDRRFRYGKDYFDDHVGEWDDWVDMGSKEVTVKFKVERGKVNFYNWDPIDEVKTLLAENVTEVLALPDVVKNKSIAACSAAGKTVMMKCHVVCASPGKTLKT